MIKKLKYLVLFFVLLFIFRGFCYRNLLNYSKVGTRANIVLTDDNLIQEIDKEINGKILSIYEIVSLSNQLTSKKLHFTFSKTSGNANKVLVSKKANCIGYASLFNSIVNYMVSKQKMSDKYECKHLVGKIDLLGLDIHALIDNSFFKDHDFNEISFKNTDQKIFVDPSLRDYFRINTVCSK